MKAQGFKDGVLVCEFSKPEIPIGQNGYDIDTLVIDGVSHAIDPVPSNPIEDATNNFRQARLAAPEALDRLKGTVWASLVSGGLSPDEATAAGVGLVLLHGPVLAAFEAAGGHPVAGQALYAAISSPESVAALPWLSEGILAIFAAALAPGQ